jgi:hypothetical protein
MFKKLHVVVDFFKSLTLEKVKNFVLNFFLYILELLKGIWTSVKTGSTEAVYYIIWAVISFFFGFTFSILAMLIYSCYIHKCTEEHCTVCEHESILRYTLIICIFGFLHCI